MIKNEQQKSVSQTKLKGLNDRLSRLQQKYSDADELEYYSAATRRQRDQLVRELAYYQLARDGDVDALIRLWNEHGRIRPESKDDLTLGDLVSLMRVARGMTQAQLASALGIEQAHVARYERDDYSGYTVETIDRIFAALGVKFTLGKLDLSKAA